MNFKKTKRSSKTKKSNPIEKYFPILFSGLGMFFLLFSIYYFFSFQSDFFNKILFILSAKASDKEFRNDNSYNTLVEISLYFIPTIVTLISCLYYSKKYLKATFIGATISAVYLLCIHATILFNNFLKGGTTYPNLYIASLFLFVPVLLLFFIYKIHKRDLILYLVSFYFYVSVFALINDFFTSELFVFVLIYTIIHFIFARKSSNFFPFLVHAVFAYLFLTYFILRKFYFNSSLPYFNLFLIISALYFIIFFITSIFSDFKENKSTQAFFNWINTGLYLVINAFVIHQFYDSKTLGFLVLGVALFHAATIYYIKKRQFNKDTFVLELALLVLVAIFFPLLIGSNSIVLFIGILAVLLMEYAKQKRKQELILLSLIAIGFLMVSFTYLLLVDYFPAFLTKDRHTISLLLSGFLNCSIILVSVYTAKNRLKRIPWSISNDWFSRKKFVRFLDVFLVVNLFVFVQWIVFSGLFLVSGTFLYSYAVCYSMGCGFFLVLLKKSEFIPARFLRATYYLVLLYGLLFPFFVYFDFPFTKKYELTNYSLFISDAFVHYLALFLCLIVLFKVVSALYELKFKTLFAQRLVELVLVGTSILMVCKEYDALSVFISVSDAQLQTEGELIFFLEDNQYLAYSILILLSAVSLLILGMILKDLFLRLLAVLIMGGTLVKIFAFEFDVYTEGNRFAVFLVFGVSFLALSWVFTKFRNKSGSKRRSSRVERKQIL